MPPAHPSLHGDRTRGARLLPLFAVMLFAACAARTPISAPPLPAAPLPEAVPHAYRLQPGDLVAIKFWNHPELNEELRLRPDGRITLPFLDEVDAAGRTPAELDAELTERYAAELLRPEITVIVREIVEPKIYVGGEVGQQGALTWTGDLTLLRAVQAAGGFLPSARRRQVLLIRDVNDQERIARAIDVRAALAGSDLSADVRLEPTDIVFVPRTKITNVDLFVAQYVNNLIPTGPLVTLRIVDDLTSDN